MKKKRLLALSTTAAIIMTTALSFAAWDNLTSTATNSEISIRKPVTLQTGSLAAMTSTTGLGNTPAHSGAVTFNIENFEEIATIAGKTPKLEFTVKVNSVDEPATDLSANFDITLVDGSTDVLTAGDTEVSAANTYTLTLTPKDGKTSTDVKAGSKLKVDVEATLSTN